MSVQAAITINDGQTTPVAKTFSARGTQLGLASYRDVSSGVAIGQPVITISNRETGGSNGAYRVEARITIPVLEAISGDAGGYTAVPKVAYNMFGKVEMIAPNRCSLQNRKDLKAFVANLMAHAVISETFVDFNPPY